MSADVKLSFVLTALVDGVRRVVGTDLQPLTVTVTGGAVDDSETAIAAATTATLWDATTSPATAFSAVAILASGDVLLELQGTTTADNSHVTAKAGLPFFLFSSGTTAYNAASFGGASQVVKKILAKNNGGSPVTVRCLVIP